MRIRCKRGSFIFSKDVFFFKISVSFIKFDIANDMKGSLYVLRKFNSVPTSTGSLCVLLHGECSFYLCRQFCFIFIGMDLICDMNYSWAQFLFMHFVVEYFSLLFECWLFVFLIDQYLIHAILWDFASCWSLIQAEFLCQKYV